MSDGSEAASASGSSSTPAEGPIINQTPSVSLALVVAIVCAALMGLLIAWALFEATSQVRARFMNWCRGKPKRESKAPSSLISADSAIWSAKENGTPTIVINETFVNPSTPAPEILHPSPSPSAIVAYYIRPDNLATPNPAYDASKLAPAHVVSPVSLDYYECMASPIPDVQVTSDRNQVAKESTLRAIEEWRVKMAKGRPSTRPAKRI